MSEATEHASPPRNTLKRPRPVISCLECRRKKLKCDRTYPCQQCTKTGRPSICTYQPGQEPELSEDRPIEKQPRHVHTDNQSDASRTQSVHNDPSPNNPTIHASSGSGVLEQLIQRVSHLEEIAGINSIHSAYSIPATPAQSSLTAEHQRRSVGSRKVNSRYGFPNAIAFMRALDGGSNDPAIVAVGDKLRNVYATLKAYHQPQHQSSAQLTHSELVQLLPSRSTCESLIELYFDNLEHCFRILHRPTFDQQFDKFCRGEDNSEHDTFLPHLLGVISVAAMLEIRRECMEVLTAAGSDIVQSSIEYMQRYLDNLSPKRRHQIPALQTQMLSNLLRWMRLDRMGDLWNVSGQVIRQALVMGLDKDPSELPEPIDTLQAEMRRRLWMSAVEQDMMLSILCNMPCLIPDFTCKSPLNVNDNELRGGTSDIPLSRPIDEWTDSLCQFILAKSIRQRLHACKDLDNGHNLDYNHCLEHTRCFEKILQAIPAPLRFTHMGDETCKAPARLMARMEFDISIRRPLMHLYSPFAYANNDKDIYHEARNGFIQSCLMLTNYQDLFDPNFSEIDVERPRGYWDFFHNLYRQELSQALLGLCLEIHRLATSIGPEPNQLGGTIKSVQYTRSTLVHAVKDTLEPMIRRISSKGANLKDIAYLVIVFNSVRTTSQNNDHIIAAIEDLVVTCKSQLERDGVMLVSLPHQQGVNGDAGEFAGQQGFDPSWTSLPNFGLDFGVGDQSFDFFGPAGIAT